MRILCGLLVLLAAPGFVLAASFVAQESSFDITTWRDINTQVTHYGELTGFPHTFEFLVGEPTTFAATLAVRKGEDPVSLILVKEVSRGVQEVVRISAASDEVALYKDTMLGLRFLQYAPLTRELTDGIYRLEISAPSNMAKYQLTIGTQETSQGYFARLGDIFSVHSFFGTWVGAVRSPYVYWPVLLILFAWYGMRYTRRNLWPK